MVSEIAQPKLYRNGDIGADKPGVLEPKGEPLQTTEVTLNDVRAYMKVDLNVMSPMEMAEGQKLFESAENHYRSLSCRIEFKTPDPYINALGSALVLAADGDWDGQTWLHGCIGWRMPLPGWRAAYVGDVMGWPERQQLRAACRYSREECQLNAAAEGRQLVLQSGRVISEARQHQGCLRNGEG